MQTIIWEVIEDGAANFNLTSGAFRLYSADVRDKANAFWNLILTGQLKPVKFNVLSARGTQDLIVTEVPIPGGIFLFGSAVAGFAFARAGGAFGVTTPPGTVPADGQSDGHLLAK